MRLTQLASCAGCAAKLPQGKLTELLGALPPQNREGLLIGFENSDDAGVFDLGNGTVLVQTVDFFTPIVDDPYTYGQIAAANALSDVYAMGGIPKTALNLACFEPDLAPDTTWAEIFRGLFEKCVEAEVALVGGHTIRDKEPKFGLSVTGIVDPERMFGNTFAKPGDRIYLTKKLGTGIVTSAIKAGAITEADAQEALQSMAKLNAEARDWGLAAGVRCATDITGFGLIGHLFNVARASGVQIVLNHTDLPVFDGVQELIAQEHTTGGARNNLAFLGDRLTISGAAPGWIRDLVSDPQTSGGLALFSQTEIPGAVCIGSVRSGDPSVHVV